MSMAVKNLPISVFQKLPNLNPWESSIIKDNAENGGMAIDTRFVFTLLWHQ